MSGLFGGKAASPSAPATMPDASDIMSKRNAQKSAKKAPGSQSTRIAPMPGTIGKEYTRGTLG